MSCGTLGSGGASLPEMGDECKMPDERWERASLDDAGAMPADNGPVPCWVACSPTGRLPADEGLGSPLAPAGIRAGSPALGVGRGSGLAAAGPDFGSLELMSLPLRASTSGAKRTMPTRDFRSKTRAGAQHVGSWYTAAPPQAIARTHQLTVALGATTEAQTCHSVRKDYRDRHPRVVRSRGASWDTPFFFRFVT